MMKFGNSLTIICKKYSEQLHQMAKSSGKEIIKTHDILYLGKKAELPSPLLEKIKPLLAVAIESRYGDIFDEMPFEKFNSENTEAFINIADEVLKWTL